MNGGRWRGGTSSPIWRRRADGWRCTVCRLPPRHPLGHPVHQTYLPHQNPTTGRRAHSPPFVPPGGPWPAIPRVGSLTTGWRTSHASNHPVLCPTALAAARRFSGAARAEGSRGGRSRRLTDRWDWRRASTTWPRWDRGINRPQRNGRSYAPTVLGPPVAKLEPSCPTRSSPSVPLRGTPRDLTHQPASFCESPLGA